MFKYFKTKTEIKRLEQKRRKAKIKFDEERWTELNRIHKQKKDEEAREANHLSETYKMIRYWIRFDGTIEEYTKKYANHAIRANRLLFLDEEITKHTPETQKYINEETSKQTGKSPTPIRSFWPRNMDSLFLNTPLEIIRPIPRKHNKPEDNISV